MSPLALAEQALEEESSGTSTVELSIEEGQNYLIDDGAKLPFDLGEVLGMGKSAFVQKVRDRNSNRVFAMKTIKFGVARLRAENEDRFNNEVEIIRKLMGHHHIIRIFATYVAKREFGMILEPVASMNLSQFLEHCEESGNQALSKDAGTLRKSFGCLASGLAYIHQRRIRHKDIKPQNILVHQGNIIYTDFGASKAFTVAGEGTTEGPPDFLTKRYSAPEVIDHDRRNFAADVFSLGCVFVEILSALCPAFTYDRSKIFSTIIEQLHQDLKSVQVSQNLSSLPDIITSMTLFEMSKRAHAHRISGSICVHTDLCCKICSENPVAQPDLSGARSSWTWSPAEGQYYSYVYEEGIVIKTLWSNEPGV